MYAVVRSALVLFGLTSLISRGPQFKQPDILLQAESGLTTSIPLLPLLVSPESNLRWTLAASTPTWITIDTTNQALVVSPPAGAAGDTHFLISVTDGTDGDINHPADLTVVAPPQWTQTPVNLGTQHQGQSFTFDLKTVVSNPSGSPLQFTVLSGLPSWMSISSSGIVTGTPALANIGAYQNIELSVTATDSGYVANDSAFGVVVNDPPRWTTSPLALGNLTAGQTFQFNLAAIAVDPDGNPLTFSLTSGPSWITVTANGMLTATPTTANLGAFQSVVSVTDGITPVPNNVTGTVITPPKPPVVVPGSLVFTVKAGATLAANLNSATYVTDPQGSALSFSATGLPSWVSLTTVGTLNLSPALANVGNYSYPLTITDALGASASASLIIYVVPPTITVTDATQIDKAVPNAPIENVWIFDNFRRTKPLTRALEENIPVYFDALKAAGVSSSAVMISSIYGKYAATPVASASGSTLLLGSESDPATDFVARDNSEYVLGLLVCGECQSPIWTLFQFYQKLPTLAIFQHQYQMPEIPSDVMIVTPRTDNYAHFDKGTAQAAFAPADFVKSFQALHAGESKPYRISAIAASCSSTDLPEEDFSDENQCRESDTTPNAYQTLTTATAGVYYPWSSSANVASDLGDYAQKVIFRAYVFAKIHIPLSKTPTDPTKIVVTLGTTVLTNPTQWQYEPATNSIHVHWSQINPSLLQAGEMLQISYTAAD